jgi:RND family efflux transporter MFP subunit
MMKKVLTHFVLPLAIIGGGAAGAATLVRGAQEAESKPPAAEVPTVFAETTSPAAYATRVEANGVVEATRSLTLVPEVGGKVTKVHPALVEGGRISAGDLLVRVESTAYRIALAQAEAELARAKADLELEQGRGRSASREWERFGEGKSADAGRLAKREPQLASAQALVDLRQAAVDKAKLDMRRTSLKAPFDAIVQSEQVEVGQVVNQGAALATLVASEEMWVRAPVRLESLAALHLADEGGQGSEVQLRLDTGRGRSVVVRGEALRLGPQIDTDTRKAELIIRLGAEALKSAPLLPGAFVTLELDSASSRDAVRITRDSLVEGGRAWLVDVDLRLRRLELDIAWTDRDAVYVESSTLPSELRGKELRIVARPAPGLLQGMEVKVADAPAAKDQAVAASGKVEAAAKAEADHG